MFWFKKKKIVLDCFTSDPFAYEYTPIMPATSYYPDWWKKLPSNQMNDEAGKDVFTMKVCKGFTDLYKNSFVVPFWGHLKMEVNDKTRPGYQWEANFAVDSFPQVTGHHEDQYGSFVGPEFRHVKLMNPWKLKTNKFVKFLMSDAIWNRSNLTDYTILPGILDFTYQPACHVNLLIECKEQPRTILWEPAKPLVMLTPICEEEVDIKLHLIDEKEMIRVLPFNRLAYSWLRPSAKYSSVKKFIEEHNERKQQSPKCPFGFGK